MSSVKVVDLLVIGGGISGGSCALRAADAGLDVLVIVKAPDPNMTATAWAQGGIVSEDDTDSTDLLVEDIIEAGDGIGREEAARQLAELGPDLVTDLLVERLGVPFDREVGGRIARTVEAAHSRRRIVHVGDATGYAIQEKLTEALLRHERITVASGRMAVDLITRSHHDPDPSHAYAEDRVLGAYVLDEATGDVDTVLAHCTVLATGGLGQIFLHTTNPEASTGDGVAMAYRAGLAIRNLEYVQFHPTAFFSAQGDRFLISEAVRGEGAWLLDAGGRRFTERCLPDRMEMSPRDELARCIHEEMASSGHPCVYLELAGHHREDLDVRARFPGISSFLQERNLDLARDRIPVVPAAHYSCGGVLVGLDGRVPSIGGLYAVGEVSCTGLHGANRLASTSLLEGLVWGWRAGEACRSDVVVGREGALDEIYARIPPWDSEGCVDEVDPILFRQDWTSIRNTMWNYAGIVRTRHRLSRACDDLAYLGHRIEDFYRRTRLSRALLELRNGIVTARAVAEAARRNHQSIGCHYVKE